jgi:hypothetical protein
MKRTNRSMTTALVCALVLSGVSFGQDDAVPLKHKRLIGPRMGLTSVLPDGGTWEKELEKRGIGNLISQFGWQHEWVIAPQMTGPAFVVESITLLGGVEYGLVLPSTSLVMGIRMPKGFEFGMGPNIVITDDMDNIVKPSLIMAIGKSLEINGVSIPLNLAWNRNNGGNRISFLFGYALVHKERQG